MEVSRHRACIPPRARWLHIGASVALGAALTPIAALLHLIDVGGNADADCRALMADAGIDTLVACGESTSGCVRASVVDGNSDGFRMIVAEECVYDRHEATHAINLFDMDQKYAEVMPLARVLEHLRALSTEDPR